jgi:glycosyltransferase involved in cell wall biosynthesis
MTSKSKYSISAIFPAYNEEENILQTIPRAVAALENQFDDFEVIIVNDCSTDKTLTLAQELAANDKRIIIINNEKNLRQGASIFKGFAQARCDLVTHNGMDYPFDLADLSQMLPLLEDNDIVVAARTSRPGYTPYRIVLSHANLFLLRLLFKLKLHDYSFIQVYKRHVLQSVRSKGRSTGFAMPELLLRAHNQGFKIAECPIEYLRREAGIARAGHPRVIIESLRELIAFWLEEIGGQETAQHPRP